EKLEHEVKDTVTGATEAVHSVTEAVQQTVSTVKGTVQETVDTVKESVAGAGETVKGSLDNPRAGFGDPLAHDGGGGGRGFRRWPAPFRGDFLGANLGLRVRRFGPDLRQRGRLRGAGDRPGHGHEPEAELVELHHRPLFRGIEPAQGLGR